MIFNFFAVQFLFYIKSQHTEFYQWTNVGLRVLLFFVLSVEMLNIMKYLNFYLKISTTELVIEKGDLNI